MKKLYFLLFAILISGVSFGQVVISQAYGGGGNSGSTYTNDFIELFNRGTNSVSLNGWSIQYASATGTTWAVTNLPNFSLAPGQYFLIQQAAGSGGTTPLPTPDLIGTIAMSGTNFKILLSNSTIAETGACPTGSQIIDKVGFGSANCFETAAAAVLSNTTAGIRINGGCTDTNDNSVDFSVSAPNPRNSSSPLSACSIDPTLYLVGLPPTGSTIELGPEDLAGELEFATQNFTVGVDGYISWEIKNQTDGGTIHDTGFIYDLSSPTPFATLLPNKEYFLLSVLYDNTDQPLLNPEAYYQLTANTLGYNVVADIAALRAHVDANGEGLFYEITGASLVTHTDSYQNRKWIQDGNVSGLLISDIAGMITTVYNVGDNVTGLKGQTSLSSGGLLTLTPSIDSGLVASSGNSILPQLITISDFNTNYADYESEIVEIQDVTFEAGDGVVKFATGTNYNVLDAGNNIVVMRTDYFGADYIGSVIPSTTIPSLVAVAGKFGTTAQIYARSLSDFTLSNKSYDNNLFSVYPNPSSYGYVNITSKIQTAMKVNVFDILGKQVINTTVNNNRLDVSNLTTGIYIMKISQDDATTTKKLVIK